MGLQPTRPVRARRGRAPRSLRLPSRCLAALALAGCIAAPSARYRALDHELSALETAPRPEAERVFPGAATLDREALVSEVLRRNPSIAAARYAWRAALARYPQEIALEDPRLGYSLAPRTIGSSTVPQEAHRFEVSQAIPFPGKLALRGTVALAEAEAAAQDFAAVRLRLAAMASSLYDDYWLVSRSQAITDEHLALVRELRTIAIARYESGAAEQQDPLRAEVEETELRQRRIVLDTARRVTAQQIAALLHVRDGAELPPPPVGLVPVVAEDEPPVAPDRVLAQRPELQAAEARVRAREAGERLAWRGYFPDFRLSGVYDRGWDTTDMRPMVGIEIDLPVEVARRRAAVDEAHAELERARREREQTADEITTELVTARAQLDEARRLLALSRDHLLPAAQDRLSAARAGFEAGRVPFGDLIEAERSLRDARLRVDEARADTSRRAAELTAAVGRIPGLAAAARAPAPEGASHVP
jgi:cobalt-zinc-cadmium efflux system outer membrane protein